MISYNLCLNSQTITITNVEELSQKLAAGWRPCDMPSPSPTALPTVTPVATLAPSPAVIPSASLPAVGASWGAIEAAALMAIIAALAMRRKFWRR